MNIEAWAEEPYNRALAMGALVLDQYAAMSDQYYAYQQFEATEQRHNEKVYTMIRNAKDLKELLDKKYERLLSEPIQD